jgi:hypothetical protein
MNWKKVFYYAENIIPLVGIYREIKKPKDKRSTLRTIGFGIYAASVVIRIVYLSVGVITKEWNPTNYFKDSKEKIENTVKKESSLEKAVTYEDILKVIP